MTILDSMSPAIAEEVKSRLRFFYDPSKGCWIWQRGKTWQGYGYLRVNGRMESAHRVAWALFRREPIGELHVLHKCDTPSCINPDHLFLGTNADNVADRKVKGRYLVGETNGRARLTSYQILQIRQAAGSYRAIAKKFGISSGHVSQIKHHKRWGHLHDL